MTRGIFRVRYAKEQHTSDSDAGEPMGFGDRQIGAHTRMPLQGRDLLSTTTPRNHEQWRHQLIRIEARLTYERAQRGGGAKAARPLAGGGVDGPGG
jgi:hypothetical protein